ncbi:MAG: YraN family protein [Sedimentisphaerales bacterium]|nr:YraN family protein [Sedimentisphaerales bacterium]
MDTTSISQSHRWGRRGELLARKYLQKQGYRHWTSNYATERGEIDLIMQDGQTIVFVEVKALQRETFVAGEQLVNVRKQSRIARAARHFLARHRLGDYPCRFDVVIVHREGKKTVCRHWPHAFSPAV